MRGKLLWALVGTNVVLGLMALINLMQPAAATAQAGRPAEYIMIPGEVQGGAFGVVYIVDMTNGALSGMAYNDANQSIDAMRPIDLNRALGGGRGR